MVTKSIRKLGKVSYIDKLHAELAGKFKLDRYYWRMTNGSKKRILYLSRYYRDATRAAAIRSTNFVRSLVRNDFDVVLITAGDNDIAEAICIEDTNKANVPADTVITKNGVGRGSVEKNEDIGTEVEKKAVANRGAKTGGTAKNKVSADTGGLGVFPQLDVSCLPGPDRDDEFCKAVFELAHRIMNVGVMGFDAFKPDVIYVSAPPFSLLTVGEQLAEYYNIPLVIELRDAWYTGMPWPYKNRIQRKWAAYWEEKCIRQAAIVVVATNGIGDVLRKRYCTEVEDKVVTVRHGFTDITKRGIPIRTDNRSSRNRNHSESGSNNNDNKHVEVNTDSGIGITHAPLSNICNRQFIIAYTGQLRGIGEGKTRNGWCSKCGNLLKRGAGSVSRYTRRVLLGASFCEGLRLDWMSPYYLFAALRELKMQVAGFGNDLQVIFAGQRFAQLDNMAADMGLSDNVNQYGYLPVNEVAELVRNADVLMLSLYGIRGNNYHWCVPSKVYMYLAAGKPILTLAPEGELRDIVVKAGVGLAACPDDIHAICERVKTLYSLWQEGRLSEAVQPDWEFINEFKLARQVDILCNNLRKLIHDEYS